MTLSVIRKLKEEMHYQVEYNFPALSLSQLEGIYRYVAARKAYSDAIEVHNCQVSSGVIRDEPMLPVFD